MFDNFKPGDKIAEEKFIVTIPDDGTVIHYTITLEKSGAFDYGNGTCVTVHDDYPGTWDKHLDTRYLTECSTVDGFREWALKHLRHELRKDCKIEREIPPAPKKTRNGALKEYAVHFKSNDGKEEHIAGHYTDPEAAKAAANRHKRIGNRNVYVVARDVTEWKRMK